MDKRFLLILFYSTSGSTKKLAHAIADGAEEAGMKVKIRTVPRISSNIEKIEPSVPVENEIYCSKEDLIECSGLAIGSPTRFGSMASSLKYFLDSTGDIWATNQLEDKPGLAFTSTGSMHGGQEITLYNLITFMLHHGNQHKHHENGDGNCAADVDWVCPNIAVGTEAAVLPHHDDPIAVSCVGNCPMNSFVP